MKKYNESKSIKFQNLKKNAFYLSIPENIELNIDKLQKQGNNINQMNLLSSKQD